MGLFNRRKMKVDCLSHLHKENPPFEAEDLVELRKIYHTDVFQRLLTKADHIQDFIELGVGAKDKDAAIAEMSGIRKYKSVLIRLMNTQAETEADEVDIFKTSEWENEIRKG